MKWIADVQLDGSPDIEDVEKAAKVLRKKGATSIRLYISEKSGAWGSERYINVNGYK